VRAGTGGRYWLYSARELEPAGRTRVVQISEGVPGTDGMIRITQRILTFERDRSRPARELLFDESFARSKLGQRPLAVMPTGELLAIGLLGRDRVFSVRSCGFVNAGTALSELCRPVEGSVQARSDPNAARLAGGSANTGREIREAQHAAENTNRIFARLAPYATRPWSVDAGGLPEACRLPEGCAVGDGSKFVPIRGIRLSRGMFSRTGAPYAQTPDLRDVVKFLQTSDQSFSAALRRVTNGEGGQPGNLDDDYDGDIGIDCSALIQIAWNGPQAGYRLSTSALQTQKKISYRCDHRVGHVSAMKSGDAIGLNVKPGTNHAVLYAAELKFDGANTSWLVLESSSSCDGVCWSVYDPSFFNGWGIYRARGRTDVACPFESDESSVERAPIPRTADEWRLMLNKSR
jgi:hypothetical protein